MKNTSNTDFKPTPEYEVRCLLADEFESLIEDLALEAQEIIQPFYRDFCLRVKDDICNRDNDIKSTPEVETRKLYAEAIEPLIVSSKSESLKPVRPLYQDFISPENREVK